MFRSLLVLVAGLVVLFAASAMAETYTWEDSSGTIHFADDLSQVPKKYRKKVQTRDDIGPAFPAEVETKESAPADKEKGSSGKGAEKGAGEKSDKKDKLYGGKTGAAWKKEFNDTRAKIEAVDEQLADLNRRQSNAGSMSRSEYLGNQAAIKSLQEKRNELVSRMEALNASAVSAGVPSEYR